MRYKVTPSVVTAPDVVSHEIVIEVGGVLLPPLSLAPGTTGEFEADEGLEVRVVEVQIDDAGNRSEPSEALVFLAEDTIPPAKPGGPTVELIGD